LWSYSLLNYELPRLDQKDAALLTRQTRLVMLLPTRQDLEAARAALQQFGFDFDVIASENFGAGDTALAVVIADIL
jgi:hypothetical protein